MIVTCLTIASLNHRFANYHLRASAVMTSHLDASFLETEARGHKSTHARMRVSRSCVQKCVKRETYILSLCRFIKSNLKREVLEKNLKLSFHQHCAASRKYSNNSNV
jgi:hypothetical protein